MHLLEEMAGKQEAEPSMFRAQLFKEDISRLQRLMNLVGECGEFDAFLREGLYFGWTQNDMRTHELKDRIEEVLTAVFEYKKYGASDELDQSLRRAWAAFDNERMDKLVGCL